jgi:hypothetical protein
LDLVSLDCGLGDEKLYNSFCNAASDERTMAIAHDKEGRLISRLKRVEAFVEYLQREESREKGEFLLAESEEHMPTVVSSFDAEKPRVMASARKNLGRPTSSRTKSRS